MNHVVHKLTIGAVSKAELLRQLGLNGVSLNSAAQDLFANDLFCTATSRSTLEVHELAVEDLGLTEGCTTEEAVKAAANFGLRPCPLELGPHFRLQFMEQAEGQIGFPETKHCAPPGSISVISDPLSGDDDTPKGFYLRKVGGVLWLRGYRSGNAHVWSPKDRLAFCGGDGAACLSLPPSLEACSNTQTKFER